MPHTRLWMGHWLSVRQPTGWSDTLAQNNLTLVSTASPDTSHKRLCDQWVAISTSKHSTYIVEENACKAAWLKICFIALPINSCHKQLASPNSRNACRCICAGAEETLHLCSSILVQSYLKTIFCDAVRRQRCASIVDKAMQLLA